MASKLLTKFKTILPTRAKPKGSTETPTYDSQNSTEVLALPDFQEHLADLIVSRTTQNSQELIEGLLKSDPDASSALHSYLTTCDSVEPYIMVKDADGLIDREGHQLVNEIIELLETRRDYSKGFVHKKSLRQLGEEFRYMMLAQGGICAEAIMGDQLELTEIRVIELASIRFQEKGPGLLVPYQDTGQGDPVKIDIPTLFMGWFRKSPKDAYSNSPFVSAINTMAARQQVINDLYRIMQLTGFPRITITVLESVIADSAPADIRTNPKELRQYINARRREIGGQFAAVRADQPIVTTDSVKFGMLNEKNPAAGLDVSQIIEALNAQNQAGLLTMATVLGRGESGVNTATVEANLFSMSANSLNAPIAEMLGKILTLALRFQGSESRVIVKYPDVDLRSELELESQLMIRSQRLRQDLSDGLLTDDEYHLMMYRRIRPENSPELSGTGFNSNKMEVDVAKISPNSDPVGASVSKASDKQAKSN